MDATTGKQYFEEVEEEPFEASLSIEELKERKQRELMEAYKEAITKGMVSTSTGEEVTFGYSPQDQLNYTKWANVLSLDPNKEFVTIGSSSHGVVQLTRAQFLQFSRDCEKHEMDLYTKRIAIHRQLETATTSEELNAIFITME
jgi:hypothetical protein